MENCELLIKNCKEVVSSKEKFTRGKKMKNINVWNDIDIAIKGNKIVDMGKNLKYRPNRVIDASQYVVMLGFINFHTHLVFGGSRDEEYLMRIRGESYEKIAEEGGGIKNTVLNTRKISEDDLFN